MDCFTQRLFFLLFSIIILKYCQCQDYGYSDYDDTATSDDDYNYPDPNIPQVDKCNQYTNCTSFPMMVTNCFCDPLCHNFNDCCRDAATPFSEETIVVQREVACHVIYVKSHEDVYAEKIRVIDDCPEGKDNQSCQDSYMLPVGGKKTGLLYKSYQCALCNDENNVYKFMPNLTCSRLFESYDVLSEIFLSSLMNGTYSKVGQKIDHSDGTVTVQENIACLVYYQKTNESSIHFHNCMFEEPVSTCPQGTDREQAELCETGDTSYVYTVSNGDSGAPIYRNADCKRCNTGGDVFTVCEGPRMSKIRTDQFNFATLVRPEKAQCYIDTTKIDGLDCNSRLCPDGQEYIPFRGCPKRAASFPNSNETCQRWINTSNFNTLEESVYLPDYQLWTKIYIMQEGQITACIDQTFKGDKFLKTISTILVSLSLIALFIHLLIFVFVKALRNRPAIITISLVSSLFVALLALVFPSITPENEKVCISASVIQHYAFLAMFFWTNVMAYDITRMLTDIMRSQGKKRFIWFSLYAWSAPLVIVISAILCELYNDKLYPKYGSPECLLNNRQGLLVFFVAPIGIIVFVNIILYILSIIYTIKSARQTRMVNPNSRDRFILAFRLFLILGLTWMFSLVTYFLEHPVVDYIFVILNSSQGLLITISFVFSKNARIQIRGFHQETSRRLRTTSSTASSQNYYMSTKRKTQSPSKST